MLCLPMGFINVLFTGSYDDGGFMMEILIQGAVNGSWPAAFAFDAACLAAPVSIVAFFWGVSKIL